MRRLAAGDASRVLAFIEATQELDGEEPLPVAALSGLLDLIPSAYVEHAEFDDRLVLHSYVATTTPPEGSGEAWWATYAAAVAGDALRPEDGAARMSELMPAWRKRPGWYFDSILTTGIRDVVKVWLPVERPLRSILLINGDADFSVRDRDVLDILQGHLTEIRERSTHRRLLRRAVPALTTREAEVVGAAARGLSNAQIALRLQVSPGTVAKHLENAYAKLDVRSRSEAVAILGFVLGGGHTRLDAGNAADPGRLLTTRELHVLTWAARGRRNDEIAALLFITARTVAKHLEHAYEKLGARSRLDAVAILRRGGLQPSPGTDRIRPA